MPSSPQRQLRPGISSPSVLVLALLGLVAIACGATSPDSDRAVSVEAAPAASTITANSIEASRDLESEPAQTQETQTSDAVTQGGSAAPSAAPEPTPTPHPLVAADTELPQAPIGFDSLFDTAPAGPQPISVKIENINVRDAAVIPVGVNPEDLSFEVPPADQIGWYEFGSSPGEPGSAVLAAHIAFDGVDGVFRYLEDVEVGSVVVVGFDDGSSLRYRIENVTEYNKEALPDSLWARDGREQLALITCGGAFNHQLSSYESNTVAIAVPI